MTTLAQRALGWRHGVVADVAVANWAATGRPLAGGPAAGGAGRHDEDARTAAVAEAVERYAAAVCPLPVVQPAPGDEVIGLDRFTLHGREQRAHPEFPYAAAYPSAPSLTDATALSDGRRVLVPLSLVTLDPERTALSTSSGLAADPSPLRALLRAVQELVERDAFMATWLHGLAPAQVELPEPLRLPEVACFDLTQAWSPHPVAAVAGNRPVRGRPRLSLGLACRARWEDAVEKAWLEWAQGTVFAGTPSPAPLDAPDDCADFDAHARWYTAHPEQWNGLPLWNGPRTGPPPDAEITGRPDSELAHLGAALADAGIEVFFRELTTVDAACVGLRVVRALAPQLVPIHGHHRWPHLGGTAADLAWRYPGLGAASHFPNPAPHPLG